MKKLTKKIKWLANAGLAVIIVIVGIMLAVGAFNWFGDKAEEKVPAMIDKVKSYKK